MFSWQRSCGGEPHRLAMIIPLAIMTGFVLGFLGLVVGAGNRYWEPGKSGELRDSLAADATPEVIADLLARAALCGVPHSMPGAGGTEDLLDQARAVERLTGLKLYEVYDFDPKWTWDCDGPIQCEGPDGTVETRPHGPPPTWLLERMRKKGVEVLNLPERPEPPAESDERRSR